ncbi:6581_t:CDS:2, partial [Racocetra persica]
DSKDENPQEDSKDENPQKDSKSRKVKLEILIKYIKPNINYIDCAIIACDDREACDACNTDEPHPHNLKNLEKRLREYNEYVSKNFLIIIWVFGKNHDECCKAKVLNHDECCKAEFLNFDNLHVVCVHKLEAKFLWYNLINSFKEKILRKDPKTLWKNARKNLIEVRTPENNLIKLLNDETLRTPEKSLKDETLPTTENKPNIILWQKLIKSLNKLI